MIKWFSITFAGAKRVFIYQSMSFINTLRPGQDGRHFGRRHLQMQMCQWKCFNFDKNVIEVGL